MIDVTLLGTGGMMPLPGRFLTSLYVRTNGRAVLIDAGEGTQTAIRTASLRFKCIDAILITHYHADHVSGLPGLFLTIGNEGRTEPIHLYGPSGLARVISAFLTIIGELPYDLIFHELPGEETRFECANLSVTAVPADHGMPCFFYHLSLSRPGKFDPARARQNGVPLPLWAQLQKGEAVGGFSPSDVLGPARRGLSLLYATDTRPVDRIALYGKEADLMILEGMFGEEEKKARAIETHHMTMQEAARLAEHAGAKELWLTHYSPATPHPEEFEETIKAVFENTVVSVDGQTKTLQFDS
ncbi:MAG: ribonuclease Z [Clostridiales bacterium]|nr:ribonuclease Z [Clostridiales bacterium]